MNGEMLHMPVSDDRQAMRRVFWDFVRRNGWVLLVVVSYGIYRELNGRLERDVLSQMMMAMMIILAVRSDLSSPAQRVLPFSRQGIAKAIWRLSVAYPLVLMAVLRAAQGLYWGFAGEPWREALGRSLYSLSLFVVLDGVIVAAVALRWLWPLGERAVVQGRGQHDGVGAGIGILLLALLLVWKDFVDKSFANPSLPVMVIHFLVGGGAVAISYRFRDNLLIQFPKTTIAEAKRSEFGLVWSTRRREVWGLVLLKHMSSNMAWSACVASLTVVVCFMILFPGDRVFQVDSLVGFVVGASILSLCGGWLAWKEELRVWRMLPLGRVRCGGAILGFIAAASIVPWSLAFVVVGSLPLSRGYFSGNALFSLLGVSLVAQGAALPIFPGMLRGLSDNVRTVLLIALLFAGMWLMLLSKSLSIFLQRYLRTDLTTHGWAWMGAGALVLCAGMVVSAWHAERVLRHGDCYGKVTE